LLYGDGRRRWTGAAPLPHRDLTGAHRVFSLSFAEDGLRVQSSFEAAETAKNGALQSPSLWC